MRVELNHKHVSLIEVGALGKAFSDGWVYCLHYPEQNVMQRSGDVHGFSFLWFLSVDLPYLLL